MRLRTAEQADHALASKTSHVVDDCENDISQQLQVSLQSVLTWLQKRINRVETSPCCRFSSTTLQRVGFASAKLKLIGLGAERRSNDQLEKERITYASHQYLQVGGGTRCECSIGFEQLRKWPLNQLHASARYVRSTYNQEWPLNLQIRTCDGQFANMRYESSRVRLRSR